MSTTMTKSRTFLLSLLFLIIFSFPVIADGGMFRFDDKDMRWGLLVEGKQFCAINYKDGYENMVLTVTAGEELTGSKAVWLFPVPADPNKIVINIVPGFPQLQGKELNRLYSDGMGETALLMAATQVYPWPLLMLTAFGGMDAASLSQGLDGVNVYEHIEKYGLTTELVSIDDMTAFDNYLSSKSLIIDDNSKSIFSEYVGGNYALVVSWISDVEEYKRQQANISERAYYMTGYGYATSLGVSITFPTDKMYFPLKPTSVYGSTVVPAAIYVMGYAEPELFSDIKPYTTIEHYYQGYFYQYMNDDDNVNKNFFFNEDLDELFYTKISIDAPSKYYTQDLWIEAKSPPIGIALKLFAVRHGFWHAVLWTLLLSFIASLISAAIIFRNDAPKLWKFGLFGMINVLTLPILVTLANLFKIDARFATPKADKPSNQPVSHKTVAIATLKIVGILFVIMLVFSLLTVVGRSWRYWDWDDALALVVSLVIMSVFAELLLSPFVWAYYNNRKVMWYAILFSIIFIVMVILSVLIFAR